jgi:hypothetical protein
MAPRRANFGSSPGLSLRWNPVGTAGRRPSFPRFSHGGPGYFRPKPRSLNSFTPAANTKNAMTKAITASPSRSKTASTIAATSAAGRSANTNLKQPRFQEASRGKPRPVVATFDSARGGDFRLGPWVATFAEHSRLRGKSLSHMGHNARRHLWGTVTPSKASSPLEVDPCGSAHLIDVPEVWHRPQR